MELAPHFLIQEDTYERGWSAEILAACGLEPYQQLALASADRDEFANHLRRLAYQMSIPPREVLAHADLPLAFLEWWLQRTAESPNLECRELERRRALAFSVAAFVA
ncbi:MAG: hypothetical protein FJ294_11495 [Planctomycetes bacterium]|nr:hypothetical protein [Planctomycetota bacterium]